MPRHLNSKGKENSGRDVTISKALSYILRHAAEKEGVEIDSQGYANVADVVCAPLPFMRKIAKRKRNEREHKKTLAKPHIGVTQLAWRKLKSLKATFPEILHAVSTSDKKRFALLHIPSAETETNASANTTTTTTNTKNNGKGDVICEQDPTSSSSIAIPMTTEGQDTATTTALTVSDSDPSHFMIRATQGHSIKSVDAASLLEKLTLEDESKLPNTVVHGTFHAAWPEILKSGGLRSMGRNQVHFATGPTLETFVPSPIGTPPRTDELQVISGMRRDAQVLIYIDIQRALAAGCPFWRSENGVILSEGMPTGKGEHMVPLEFFDVVVERRLGMGKIWENGQMLQELPAELTKRNNPKGKRLNGKS